MTTIDWIYILMIALAVLTIFMVIIGYRWLGSEKMDKIMEYVRLVVLFIEQTMSGAAGSDKLSAATSIIQNKFKLDPQDCRILIEAAVKTLFNMDRK